MRFYTRLPAWFLAYVVALLFNWAFVLFREMRYGPIDNNNGNAIEPRLPVWLSWFMTPDNSLLGDNNFKTKNKGNYWSMVAWLYRNSFYGFQWSVLAARVKGLKRVYIGNRQINYHTGTTGELRVTCGPYWQYKAVKPFILGAFWVIDMGWILDDESQERSKYVVSIRLRKADSI